MLLNDVITGLSGGGGGGQGSGGQKRPGNGEEMRRYGRRGRKGEVKEGGVC